MPSKVKTVVDRESNFVAAILCSLISYAATDDLNQ